MGYFSNGTEGEAYELKYCDYCVHQTDPAGCAVWNAHKLRNDAGANDANSILHMLIPLSKDGLSNDKCLMWLAKDP